MEFGIPSGDVPLGRQPQMGFDGVKLLSQCMVNWLSNPLITKYGPKYGNERILTDKTFMRRCAFNKPENKSLPEYKH